MRERTARRAGAGVEGRGRQAQKAADAELKAENDACYKKFQVSSCLEDAKRKHTTATRGRSAKAQEGGEIERDVKRRDVAARDARKAAEAWSARRSRRAGKFTGPTRLRRRTSGPRKSPRSEQKAAAGRQKHAEEQVKRQKKLEAQAQKESQGCREAKGARSEAGGEGCCEGQGCRFIRAACRNPEADFSRPFGPIAALVGVKARMRSRSASRSPLSTIQSAMPSCFFSVVQEAEAERYVRRHRDAMKAGLPVVGPFARSFGGNGEVKDVPLVELGADLLDETFRPAAVERDAAPALEDAAQRVLEHFLLGHPEHRETGGEAPQHGERKIPVGRMRVADDHRLRRRRRREDQLPAEQRSRNLQSRLITVFRPRPATRGIPRSCRDSR